ncbi:MAG TPA: DUF3047 domain-containing protein [Gammaproteobacteria bacterium]|nr:DUF3047 domain-containing protein [Gammaproteobacteria bacterium]
MPLRSLYPPLRTIAGLALLCLSNAAFAQAIGQFSSGDLGGWGEKSFAGNTQYEIVDTEQGKALQARARSSASGMFKKIRIDLTRTPWLHWSWRVDETFRGNDERSKAGDDYPARIYVVVDGGMFFWRTRAVNYVWSSNQPVGTNWPNAFTGNAMMLAVRSADTDTGRWVQERRNVREDLKRLFGKDFTHIDAVAVMTDSDNTGQTTSALYGDIYFASE